MQPADVARRLVDGSALVPDPRFAEPGFADATDWLLHEMNRRLPTHGNGAIWLWAKAPYGALRRILAQSRGEALIRCRISRERVLLSGFGDWHFALNGDVFLPPITGESARAFDARLAASRAELEKRLAHAGAPATSQWEDYPGAVRDHIVGTWSRMLDPDVVSEASVVQASAHSLQPDDVVSISLII